MTKEAQGLALDGHKFENLTPQAEPRPSRPRSSLGYLWF